MKDFLYLVQTRAKNVPGHLALESRRADVLIHTFDAAVNNPNCIYKKNTSWASGRNLLVEAARKKKKRYRYYVLLDDDVAFAKGGFAEFEDEVLKIKPDFCTPVHRSKLAARWLANLTPFRYSTFIDFDCYFVCMTEELFFGDKLLPYYLEVNGISCENNFYSSWKFWFDLLENYPKSKLLALNKIHSLNLSHKYPWHTGHVKPYMSFKTKGDGDNGKTPSNLAKAMPVVFLFEGFELRGKLSNKIGMLKQSRNQFVGAGKIFFWAALSVLYLKLMFMERYYLKTVLPGFLILALWRDVKLNCRLLLEDGA